MSPPPPRFRAATCWWGPALVRLVTLQKEGWDQTPLAGLDKPRMELSGSNCTAKDLAPTFSLELRGTCFAAGPKESDPGVVLREEMKTDGWIHLVETAGGRRRTPGPRAGKEQVWEPRDWPVFGARPPTFSCVSSSRWSPFSELQLLPPLS